MIVRILDFLNPISHLGDRRYPVVFPTITILLLYGLIELLSTNILSNQNAFGSVVIFTSIVSIIYFAFRCGVRGAFITTIITTAYYFYIINSRHYTGEQMRTSVETTAVLSIVYFFLGWVIGWLKQTIDILIDNEANEKRRMQSIVQQLPVGILITDEKGKVVQTNKQLETILGTKIPLGHIMGKDDVLVKTLSKRRPISPTQSPVYQAIQHGKAITNKEFTIDKDGKQTIVQVAASPIRNRKNVIIAAASIITDITQQKEGEKRKDDFVNMASHELKTPITSLRLYIDVLRRQMKKYKNKKVTMTVSHINSQTDRLQDLVNDLLDVSRLQTGKLTFTKEQFRLDELVISTAKELKEMSRDHAITITKKTPMVVTGDRFRIYQVITNLITNAIKYSPEKTGITIAIERKKENAQVSVRDSGLGVAKDQQKKIFERLYQVDDSARKTYPGFGMGLYIAKEIIKKHKGHIWVESEGIKEDIPEKQRGSTFYFTIPVEKK